MPTKKWAHTPEGAASGKQEELGIQDMVQGEVVTRIALGYETL